MKHLFLLGFATISGALPAFADPIEDARVSAIWKAIESRPDTKATPDMAAVDVLVIYGDQRSFPVVGFARRTGWAQGKNERYERAFSTVINRPCWQVIAECFRADGMWLETKTTAGK